MYLSIFTACTLDCNTLLYVQASESYITVSRRMLFLALPHLHGHIFIYPSLSYPYRMTTAKEPPSIPVQTIFACLFKSSPLISPLLHLIIPLHPLNHPTLHTICTVSLLSPSYLVTPYAPSNISLPEHTPLAVVPY